MATTTLSIQPSEFWKMPFFVLREMSIAVNGEKKEKSRAEILDEMRERKKRLGWK